jgi:hypothetical protein
MASPPPFPSHHDRKDIDENGPMDSFSLNQEEVSRRVLSEEDALDDFHDKYARFFVLKLNARR